jgi:head-tail adaptor
MHYNRKIVIQEQSVSRNLFGEEVVSWVTWKEAWAHIEVAKAGQKENYVEATKVMSSMNTTYQIRNIGTPTVKMRLYEITTPSRVYDIENVVEVQRRKGWILETKLRE